MKIWGLGLFLIFLFLLMRFAFVFKQVECQIVDASLEAGVCQEITNHLEGRSFFFTNITNLDIWQQLLNEEKYSQSYQLISYQKKLPGQLLLQLSSQLPYYRLRLKDGSSFLLNENNKLKEDKGNLKLLELNYLVDKQIIEHAYINEIEHEQFLTLAKAIKEHNLPISKINWRANAEIELEIDNPALLVLIDDAQDFRRQMKRLALVLNDQDLTQVLAEKRSLDLRFNLPVLK